MTKKKWLNKIIIYISFPFIFFFYKLIHSTYRVEIDKKKLLFWASKKPIIAFLHQRIFILIHFLAPLRPTALVGESDDGQLLAKVLSLLGIKIVSGSTGKENAVRAILSLIKIIKKGEILLTTVDGPLGPAGKVKKGTAYIASNAQTPVMLISGESDRYWEFKSWDKLRIPKPFAKVRIEFLDPIEFLQKLTPKELEKKRKELEEKLAQLDKNISKKIQS